MILRLAAVALAVSAGAAHAADPAAGRAKAMICKNCHGFDGLAKIPGAANLAGQNEMYFIKAFNDYRTGARRNDLMNTVAAQTPPEDDADLAAFYASIRPED